MKNNRGHSTIDIIYTAISWMILILFVGLAFLGILWLADKRMQTYEEKACEGWVYDYGTDSGRTPPEWMVDQCARYNIKVK